MNTRRRTDTVRPYVITQGRAEPSRNAPALDLVSLVSSVPDRAVVGLGPEPRRIVDLCRAGSLAVAEVAAHARLPLTVTRVLIGDLVDSGHLVVRRPPPPGQPDLGLVERVLDGLRRL